jgi:hypothetical protein
MKSIFTISSSYLPESTDVVTDDPTEKAIFNNYRSKKPIVPYTPDEEYGILIGNTSDTKHSLLLNIVYVPYKCTQWSNDRYKPVDTYSYEQHNSGFISKPVSMETTKTDNEYNPRLSFGRILYTYPLLFPRDKIINPYPKFTTPLNLLSIKISQQTAIELPPTITVLWSRPPRYIRDSNSVLSNTIDCVMDSDGLYLPCDTIRIPNWTDTPYIALCDVWTIDDVTLPKNTQIQFTFRMD